MAERETTKSPQMKIVITLTWIIVAAAALLVLAHVFIRPVSPEQATPPGHFGEPCVACHIVTEQADTIDMSE